MDNGTEKGQISCLELIQLIRSGGWLIKSVLLVGFIIVKQLWLYYYLQTDLAHHNPFTIALRNFGNKPSEQEKGKLVPCNVSMKQFK